MFEIKKELFRLECKKKPSFDLIENAEVVSDISANPAGDWYALAAGVRTVADRFDKITIVEVGTAHGASIRNMYNFMQVYAPDKKVEYCAVDSKLHNYEPYFISNVSSINFINGMSTDPDIISQVPNQIHFLFVDACHCKEHVYQDLKNYTPKLVQNGCVALHDCLPQFQGGTEQPSTPQCDPDDTHIGVLKGIDRFEMKKRGYNLIFEDFPTDKNYGGTRIYSKDTDYSINKPKKRKGSE